MYLKVTTDKTRIFLVSSVVFCAVSFETDHFQLVIVKKKERSLEITFLVRFVFDYLQD